ncbi:MAG TPA: 6-phosphogluconolactonase [Desulfobulbus sp.]|nr:6-phosphogluconolactonase [Desulfobulbus sp.]HHD64072.1 6-phosphogluconolactonase [Desulfobulbaceae bacterium]
MPCTRKEFSDQNTLTAALAEKIGALLSAGIAKNGRASLVVSGGSTPVALFERLSGLDIAWQDVGVTLVDERWLAPSEVDSNEYLVRQHLLKDKAASAIFIGMKNSAGTAEAGETECAQQLALVPRPFDVLVLGMGGDGHTASLFPGADKLQAATDLSQDKLCMAITPPVAPYERMTLTLPAILNARRIFVHITGEKKKEALEKALADGPSEVMPIRFILRQKNVPVTVFWAP